MRTRLPALILFATLAWGFNPSAHAQAPSESSGTVHVTIVDDTLDAKARAALHAEVERVLAELATAHDLTIVETDEANIQVRFEVSRPQADAPLFIVQAIAKIADEAIRGETRSCLRCSTTELVAQGFEIFPDAVAKLSEQRDAEAAAAAAALAVESEPAPEPVVPPPPPKPLGPVGYVGIAASGLGLASAIAGGVLLTREPKLDAPGLGPAEFINYRPPGIALLGVGLGVMVVGNVLLAVDLGPLAERRRARAQVTGIGMTLGPSKGVVVEGRF